MNNSPRTMKGSIDMSKETRAANREYRKWQRDFEKKQMENP